MLDVHFQSAGRSTVEGGVDLLTRATTRRNDVFIAVSKPKIEVGL
ncbi:hypothetical protein PAMC26510_31515 [Caballeronia sordidicola]|uniref:Uncharacterized protein n=1 Tax=Caballeronia sordidicola TaxID=196367 RepID=A0A242M7Q7_CABSO|nr:hypothetical protein PAMC26510_31515 [Caballeronia sordidicola]